MTRILTSMVLLVLLFPSLASGETVKFEDLIVREGLHYKKFTDVPFTGEVTGIGKGKLKNGKEEGPWVYYHKNGQLSTKGTYKDGKEEGPWVDYFEKNGQLMSKGTYKDGKLDGPWVLYHSDGEISARLTWKDGKRVRWVDYNDDGTVRFVIGPDGVKVK